MEKGYYGNIFRTGFDGGTVAIHNKNGKGLLQLSIELSIEKERVAIHNKNGKGLLPKVDGYVSQDEWGRNPQ
mgnify:CR=1 FL=1